MHQGTEITHHGRFALTSFLSSIGMGSKDIIELYSRRSDFTVELRHLRLVLLDKWLIVLSVAMLGLQAGSTVYSNFMAYYLESVLHMNVGAAGTIASLALLFALASAPFSGRLYDRYGNVKRLLLASGLLMTLGVGLAFLGTVYSAILSGVLVGIASGAGFTFGFSAARAANRLDKEYETLAVSWVNSISLFGDFVPPLLYSYLVIQYGYSPAWLCMAVKPARPIVPPPRWPLRTKAGAGGWKAVFFGVEKKATVEDLDVGAGGARREMGEGEEMGARTTTGVLAAAARAKTRRTTVTAKAAKDGIPAGHKKIISEVLAREDAKPTGDAVRMAVSNPRREFARYQVPTDRGLKDIEIFDGRVKVRSESMYGFRKAAEDGVDGLPDRVAPQDEAEALDESPVEMPPDEEMLPDEEPDEAAEGQGGLRLHVDIVATPPDGMDEEDLISILDEALLDPEIADAINAKLEGSGVTLRVLEVETYEEDECTPTPGEDEMTEMQESGDEIEEVVSSNNPDEEGWGGRECYACNARLYGDTMKCPDCGAKQKPLGGPGRVDVDLNGM
jgi:hypothetical protein